MKTLATLTAVAALIAGVSIANAQMSPTSKSSGASSGMSQQATGTGRYCIETSPGGALNCKYASLAACQKDAKAQSQTCAPNPKSTTGSKQ
jgi:hypothetical protein